MWFPYQGHAEMQSFPPSLVSVPPWAEAMEALRVCPDWDDQGQPQQLFTVRWSDHYQTRYLLMSLGFGEKPTNKKNTPGVMETISSAKSLLKISHLLLKSSQRSPTNSRGSSINVWPFWKRLPKQLWPEVKYSFPFLPKHCRTNQPVLAVVSAPHHNTRLYIIRSVARKSQVPPFCGKDLLLTSLLDPMC